MLNSIIQVIAVFFGTLAALLSITLFFRFRWPAAMMWMIKLYTSALSTLLLLIGLVVAFTGLVTNSLFLSVTGFYNLLVYFIHIHIVTRPPEISTGFEAAFGRHWQRSLLCLPKIHFLSNRSILKLPSVANPRLEQNLTFATISGTARSLLCDVWQPPENVKPSGLAFIYLHGSAFYFLDKDCGTRTLFRHLASQGHVIMDVAYRLAPETNMMGMVHDVRRAIDWMRDNAGSYGVNPAGIVLAGGSAGGHLALLTAYTLNNPSFSPSDLDGKDTSVCAVVSLYGTNDLKALYYHTRQHLTTRALPGRPKKAVPTKMPKWMVKAFGENYHRLGFDKVFEKVGNLPQLLGGHPDECPEKYAFFSPINHVHSNCPPTLLIQGEHDIMAPVKTTRYLCSNLKKNGVPVVMHILPQADHGFDLVLPKISPTAHNLYYDLERFLATMVVKSRMVENKTNIVQTIANSRDRNYL